MSCNFSKVLGSDTDTLIVMNNLASLYYTQGKDQLAEQLYKQVLDGEFNYGRRLYDIMTMNNLACLYRDIERGYRIFF